jgi:hypothetical protein
MMAWTFSDGLCRAAFLLQGAVKLIQVPRTQAVTLMLTSGGRIDFAT